MVETLALILTFSPGEKEEPLSVFRFVDDRPANSVAGFSVRRRKILPLLGGEGRGEGERETFFPAQTQLRAGQDESGGERARTPDASRTSRTPGRREAFGVRVSLAPLSGEARKSTPPVSPKSDSSRWNQTCPAEIR